MSDASSAERRRDGSPPGSMLRALRDVFVAPAESIPPTTSPARAAAVSSSAVALLCPADDARAVAAAAATLLARRRGAPCALACVWTPDDEARAGSRPLSTGAARRLADTLGRRGLPAGACGRAALVALPADPVDAASVARRAFAAAGDAPTVLVVGGPRDGAFDALLNDQDLVVVLSRGAAADAVRALAVEGLAAEGLQARGGALALGPAARALALSGATVPAALRRVLDEPLAELR
jgi:hypothetical protein